MWRLHVLAHVEAQEGDPQHLGEPLGHLGLADAGGAGQKEGAHGLLGVAQAGAGDLDRRAQPLDRLVLAEDLRLELGFEAAELLLVVALHPAGRDLGHGGQHLFEVRYCATSASPRRATAAPASSSRSIALSGSLRSRR